MATERSMSLLLCMYGEGLLPSEEGEEKRKIIIEKLRKIVVEWTKRVAFQRRLPRSSIRAASATILVYGSCGLGAHAPDSDIDALCVGPSFATITEDFFIVLRNMLASRNEVSEIMCIKNARVPLMRFRFDGFNVDLPYVKLNINAVPENLDVFDPLFVANIDEISSQSLSGVRANAVILQLVTDHEVYKSLLRFIKCWAKRRGIYGQSFGFLGGIHLAILVAFVCWRHPNTQLSAMLVIFFETFAFWPWPAPVILGGDVATTEKPENNHVQRLLMPIQLPCSPNEYCHCNITKSTFKRIRIEFLHAHNFTKDIMIRPEFDWRILIAPFSYAKKYASFLKICISSSQQDELGDWVGWVKSRIHRLLIRVEEVLGICDPNPTEYIDVGAEPNVTFYWGLFPGRRYENINIESIKADFLRIIFTGCECSAGMLNLTIVKASEVPNSGCASIRPWWRILDYNKPKAICLYSRHAPGYFVGYSAIAN